MCNVLKLYFGLKAKRLWRMLKDLGVMAAPALFLFLLMGILTVTGLVSAPIYYSFTRGDSAFLFSVFGKRYTKMLFVVEYMLLSIPFLCIFLYRGELCGVVLVPLSSVLVSIIPCGGYSLRLPTFPFLASGSYEYHRAGRLTMLLLLPLMAGGAIGVYVGNRNLVVVACMIAVSVFSMLLMREWHVEYLFNYRSAARFLKLKLLYALRNVCVIFLPFIVCLIIVDSCLPQLLLAASYYLCASLLLFQVEMLCVVSGGTNSGDDILQVIAFMVLNAIFFVSLIVIASGVLAFQAYSIVRKYKL